MLPILVSPDITDFPGSRQAGEFFEGVVNVLQGPQSLRQKHVCLGVRDTDAEALEDAERDASILIELWKHKVLLPGGRAW